MEVSIIIPTYKRHNSVVQTLGSLQEQTSPPSEILLMDNAADSDLERLVRDFNRNARFPVRYVASAAGGNSEARNRGAKMAAGEVLLFTDDDVTFSPNWIEAYKKAFSSNPNMLAAGGRVKPVWEEAPPPWLTEYIGGAKVFPIFAALDLGDEFQLRPDGFFYSCNMALRKEIFARTGLRPEMVCGRTIGNGESGLNQELHRDGIPVGYVPDAIVYHHIPCSRMTVSYIRRWAWHLGGAEMFERWCHRPRSFSELAREAARIVRRSWRIWLRDLRVRQRLDPAAIRVQFEASRAYCHLRYVWWMATDPVVQAALDQRDYRP